MILLLSFLVLFLTFGSLWLHVFLKKGPDQTILFGIKSIKVRENIQTTFGVLAILFGVCLFFASVPPLFFTKEEFYKLRNSQIQRIQLYQQGLKTLEYLYDYGGDWDDETILKHRAGKKNPMISMYYDQDIADMQTMVEVLNRR